MKIYDMEDLAQQKQWEEKIRECDWAAAKLLSALLAQGKFHELLGDGSLLVLADGEKLVSFLTLTKKDCIADDTLFPWIGFVFTAPEYRGNRYSGRLIGYACEKAKEKGFDKAYIATDHVGLYEKFGFTYMENRIDIYGDDSRIYMKELS